MIVSLGAASVVSCSLTERSTEEETPIARAVSGPLCVCASCVRDLVDFSDCSVASEECGLTHTHYSPCCTKII